MPAERAPRLLRTRRHATRRNAGSATRLKRSTNRRFGSSVAHRCSLACIRSTRASASDGVGHGASAFTGDLLPCSHQPCEIAALLRPVTGFPGLRLLRGLRPIRKPTADGGPARQRPPWPLGRAAFGWCPAFPLQPWPRIRRRLSPWPPDGRALRPPGAGRRLLRRPPCCCPAPIHQVSSRCSLLEGVPPLVQTDLHRSVSLAGPGPSGGADPFRRCRGCSHLIPAPPGSGCPQLHRTAATARRWAFPSHSVVWRLVAHRRVRERLGDRGADPRPRVHPWPMDAIPDPEVPARPTRRRFTAAYKVAILDELDRATEPGSKGAEPAPLGDVAAGQAVAADDRALRAWLGRSVELVEDGHFVRRGEATACTA